MIEQPQQRILAIDDEPRYTWAIRSILEGIGYQVLTAPGGRLGLEMAALEAPDLILLDVRMPDVGGIDVCRQIREFSTVPIILLTALAEEADKVCGLDAGADDYITKPFGAKELLARVRAALRRASMVEPAGPTQVVSVGELSIDLAGRRVTLGGEEVMLTSTEFRVLSRLAQQPGHVVLPEDLLEWVWGSASVEDPHLLRQVIYRIRRKLEPDPASPCYVLNRPGVGYLLAKNP